MKDTNTFKDYTLEGDLTMHYALLSKVIDAMVSSLSNRYADTTEGAVLNATKVTNLKFWTETIGMSIWQNSATYLFYFILNS